MTSLSHPAGAASAPTADSNPVASYALRSELAQFCFPAAHRDAQRKLAWVDSLCLGFLIIGAVGLKPPVPVVKTVAPLEEPLTTIIEQPPPSQPQELNPAETTEEVSDQTPDTPQVVAVALPSPSFNFSVPTRGTVVVPAAMASAPPPRPMQAPQQAAAPKLSVLLPQGKGSSRPIPPYPQEMIQKDMSGTVVLLARVDTNGAPSSITVKTSCGYPHLDKHTLDWIKRQWTFPRGTYEQEYEIPIEYNLGATSRK
jgi:protein TonB